MTEARERAIKMYWEMAKEKCPFQTEEIVNGYLEGFIDCAELFEEEDKFTLTKYARIIIDKKDECIEKLEKENAELIQENEEMKKGLGCETCQIHLEYMRLNDKIRELEQKLEQTEKDLADYQFNYPKIKELEKENAELKGSLELYENGCCRAVNECAIKDQLAQAKKIIKGLLSCCRNYPQENAEKMEQTKQFIREIEK